MPLQPCRECGKEVSTEASTCPHCGTPQPTTAPATKKKSNWLPGCLGFFLFVMIVGALTDGSSESSPPAQTHSRAGAWVRCERAVRDQLRAPSTAEFPGWGERVVRETTGGKYRVLAYVDAQNGFGAQIRNHFACDVEWSGNGYRVTNVVIE